MGATPEINTSRKYYDSMIVIFDGHCNLCNGSVNFIIERDPKSKFKFVAYQSELVSGLIKKAHDDVPESIILLHQDKIRHGSDAALEIARHLNGLWPVLYIFTIIPKFIREPIYQWVARNRYRWFGRRDQCRVPEPDILSRFLHH